MRVIVVGAGLGGLTLAQGLRQAGIDVAVHERDGRHGRPQGVSLHLDERGTTALRACLPSAQVAMAEATMGGPREYPQALSEVDGQLVVTARQPRARPGRQAHRALLRSVLLTGLADVVAFGAEFTGSNTGPTAPSGRTSPTAARTPRTCWSARTASDRPCVASTCRRCG